jgi:hypothetical protein
MPYRLRVAVLVAFLVFLPLLAHPTPVDVDADGIVGPQEVIELSLNWKGPALPYGGRQPWQVDGYFLFYNDGNVGIGTSTPAERLTIAGSAEIGTHHGDYQHLRIGGGNSSGFIFGSFPAYGDGIHFGYNYLRNDGGVIYVPHPDGGTSLISAGYGSVALATRDVGGDPPIDRLVVDSAGNVKLGPGTQLFAPGGEENLRLIRGVVAADGGILVGSGFTVSKTNIGSYTITFNTPFSGPPSVTATVADSYGHFPVTAGVLNTHAILEIGFPNSGNTAQLHDWPFHFLAVGPR